jgi:hypothetical protein
MPAPMPAPSSVPASAERGTAKDNKMIAALNAECMTDLFFFERASVEQRAAIKSVLSVSR